MKDWVYLPLILLVFLCFAGCGNEETPIRVRVVNEGGLELSNISINLLNGSEVQEIARLPDQGERTIGLESGDACSHYITAMALEAEALEAGALCAVAEPLAPGDYVLTLRISVFDGMGIPTLGLRADLDPE